MDTSGGHRGDRSACRRTGHWVFGALLSSCGIDSRQVGVGPATGCESATCSDATNSDATNPDTTDTTNPDAGSEPLAVDMSFGALDPTSGVTPLGDGVACLSESRGMELRPLALYLMLDSSGTMLETTGTSDTKWDSVQAAIRGFLTETRDSDLLLGIQFFPLLTPGSSFACTSHADCGPGGPCFLSTCLQGSDITLCETDADCPGDPTVNPCVDFGLCSASDPAAPLACVLPSTCADGLGDCRGDVLPDGKPFIRSCVNATSCDPMQYGTPAVELQPVSAAFQAIEAALTGKTPEGLTPTVPALQGSLDHARTWALSHPNQTVAVLLVTDGLPTECGTEPAGGTTAIDQVLQIAAAGAAGNMPIRTHVIGAFQPGDSASIDNVNAIAQAGGTDKAAFIDTTGQVEQQFLEAFRSVKANEAPCRLNLVSTDDLDFSRANVLFDAGNGTNTALPYVEGLLGCATRPEGWYYDTPPAQGTPNAVELCPNVCQLVKATPAAGLLLELGCAGTD